MMHLDKGILVDLEGQKPKWPLWGPWKAKETKNKQTRKGLGAKNLHRSCLSVCLLFFLLLFLCFRLLFLLMIICLFLCFSVFSYFGGVVFSFSFFCFSFIFFWGGGSCCGSSPPSIMKIPTTNLNESEHHPPERPPKRINFRDPKTVTCENVQDFCPHIGKYSVFFEALNQHCEKKTLSIIYIYIYIYNCPNMCSALLPFKQNTSMQLLY